MENKKFICSDCEHEIICDAQECVDRCYCNECDLCCERSCDKCGNDGYDWLCKKCYNWVQMRIKNDDAI